MEIYYGIHELHVMLQISMIAYDLDVNPGVSIETVLAVGDVNLLILEFSKYYYCPVNLLRA